jgi:hypothetical protein
MSHHELWQHTPCAVSPAMLWQYVDNRQWRAEWIVLLSQLACWLGWLQHATAQLQAMAITPVAC